MLYFTTPHQSLRDSFPQGGSLVFVLRNPPLNHNLKSYTKRNRSVEQFLLHIQLNGMHLILGVRVCIDAVLLVLSVLEELECNLLEECV